MHRYEKARSGIDGIFDGNFIRAGQPFAIIGRCGKLEVLSNDLDPEYVSWLAIGSSGRILETSLGNDAATGLAWFSLEIEQADLFAAQQERLRQAGVEVAAVANGLEAVDPWGTRVRLVKV